MDAVMKWGMTLCCTALAVGIAQMISPGRSMEGIFRITLGVFFLCCIISPFADLPGTLELKENNMQIETKGEKTADELSQAADQLFYASASDKLAVLAQKKLEQMGINNAKLSVYITETNQQLSAEDIVVEAHLPSDYKDRHEEICTRLGYELGTSLQISYTDGEGENDGT